MWGTCFRRRFRGRHGSIPARDRVPIGLMRAKASKSLMGVGSGTWPRETDITAPHAGLFSVPKSGLGLAPACGCHQRANRIEHYDFAASIAHCRVLFCSWKTVWKSRPSSNRFALRCAGRAYVPPRQVSPLIAGDVCLEVVQPCGEPRAWQDLAPRKHRRDIGVFASWREQRRRLRYEAVVACGRVSTCAEVSTGAEGLEV
jgi:hypothetical protein